ncbi:MAG: hypothetical protein Q7S21_05130 [archaeon]|nr:hypothetical protein [archaeon]
MKQETVTIPKKEYKELKKKASIFNKKVDWEFVAQFKKSFEDIKHGRITEWKAKNK